MKIRIYARRSASLSLIGFLILTTTTQIGCGVLFNVNRVMRLDPIVLTQDDLPMMQLTGRKRLYEFPKESYIIVGFQQRWNDGHLIVRYYLFYTSSSAKKAKANPWGYMVATPGNFQPELNPEEVIGDATWHLIPKRQWEKRKGIAEIYFVKDNVGVYVMARGTSEDQLQFVRDVSRKIEAKIKEVSPKK